MFRDRTCFYLEEDFALIQTSEPIMGSPAAITSIFNLPPLDTNQLEEFESENNVRLNILKIVRRRHHNQTILRGQKHYAVPGCQENDNPKINLAVDEWPSEVLFWLPCSSLIDNQIACTKNPNCKFTFEYPSELERHEFNCIDEQKVKSKQISYGSGETIMDKIVDAKYLPESFRSYRNTALATFDIETGQVGDALKTISIAVGSTMDSVQYFERKSSEAEDYQNLVDEFMDYLKELLPKVQVPTEISAAIEKMLLETAEMDQCPKKSLIDSYRFHLEKYYKLNVFGFNSSRFDIPILIGGIVQYANKYKIKPETLKKGAKYLTLSVGDIVFKDILNYSSPCSLDKYLRQWKAPEAKGIFPHAYFPTIESIRLCTVFPPKSAFYSKLKQCGPSDDDYDDAKSMYETKINDGSWSNFSDYLQWYNCQDVGPLVTAISNCFNKFYEYFYIDPLMHLSLPSIAFKAMFAAFDKSMPYVSSFKSDEIRQMFRESVDGGVANIYHRDVDLIGSDSPHNARFAPNGNPFTSIIFKDVNSMYLWSEDQMLPLTPGIHWVLKDKKFVKKHMASQISFKALQWLYSEQESERCRDKNGNKVQMDHAYFHGEKTIFHKKVDGYAMIDGKHVVWEFNGCHWHGCEECYPDWLEKATWIQIKNKTDWIRKIAVLEDNGCIIHIMKEHDFTPDPSIKTQMPRILLPDTQSSLLDAIKNNEVFGFVKCSVRTPDNLIEEFQRASFLFPPVIRRAVITDDLIGPFMKAQMEEQERKSGQRTLIQTYHGDDLLLMTPLVQFYLENGLQISNISTFIQYLPGRGLAPFVEKVVSMRVAATYENDDAKQLTAKLFGNSGYGKCAEKVEKHTDTGLYPPDHDIAKLIKQLLYKDHVVIQNEEGEAGATEVTCDKSSIEDEKPVHIGVAILQWSKVLFLRFMFYLYHHLEPGSFRSVYADTDSMCLALTKSRDVTNDSEEEKYRALFDPIIRPEMRESWEATWKNWVCTTTEVEDIRKPGKLKCEFMFRRGRFCALSPKTYFAYDADEDDKKTGYKGICHAEAKKLTLNSYLECLYGSSSAEVQNRGFKLNRNKQLVYYEQLKRGLNNIFCKFRVQDDHITCLPLTENGAFI